MPNFNFSASPTTLASAALPDCVRVSSISTLPPLPLPSSPSITSNVFVPSTSVMVTRCPPVISVTDTVGDTPSSPSSPAGKGISTGGITGILSLLGAKAICIDPAITCVTTGV